MALNKDEIPQLSDNEIDRILAVAKNEHNVDINLLEPLTEGYSAAKLFRASITHHGDPANVEHLIIKLEPIQETVSDEADRHQSAIDSAPSAFAKNHVTRLALGKVVTDRAVAMFYSIAGESLQSFKPIDKYKVPNELEKIFAEIGRALLQEWNSNLSMQILTPQQLLMQWVGDRIHYEKRKLDPFLEKNLKGYVPSSQQFALGSRTYPNPLLFAREAEQWGNARGIQVAVGFLHCDLHTRNILVQIVDEKLEFYLIDFAFFEQKKPLFYDHLYLELSYLLPLVSDDLNEDWIDFIDTLSQGNHLSPSLIQHKISTTLAGHAAIIFSLRNAFDAWVKERYPSLQDDLWGQFRLAAVAAGLNFCSKSRLDDTKRLAAFIYAAMHLREYCQLFKIPDRDGSSSMTPRIREDSSVTEVQTGLLEEVPASSGSLPIVSKDDPRLRTLEYWFWKKLGPEQRINVLASALGEWSVKADQPKLLRAGLDMVRQQRRLAHLWDAIRNQIPPEAQDIPNPFQEGE